MHELDHMLNGAASRRHLEDMIRQAKNEKFVRQVKVTQGNTRNASQVHAALIAVIHRIIG